MDFLGDSHGHLTEYGGLPVVAWPTPEDLEEMEDPESGLPTSGAGDVAWRIPTHPYEGEESWPEAFARFAESVDLTQVRALIVGAWTDSYEKGPEDVVETLLAARDRLTSLRSLFIGDMTFEECEISWIIQGDLTPLLTGFPELEHFGIRGGNSLVLQPVRHERLRELVVQSGGLPAEAVRAIAASDLPALTALDLWLGTSHYGATSTVADLAPFMAGTRLPSLRHLALRNSEIQDEVAAAFAAAPVVARLETLNLSMGELTDEGAAALLGGQPLTHLKTLDLHHHFVSEDVAERLREALEPAGVRLELDPDDSGGHNRRFVAVGE